MSVGDWIDRTVFRLGALDDRHAPRRGQTPDVEPDPATAQQRAALAWRVWRDPAFWLLPWERPRGRFEWWGPDPVRWRLFLAVGLTAGVSLPIYQFRAGPSISWLWSIPLFIVSVPLAIWFVLTVLSMPGRPERGTPDAMAMLQRGERRRLAFVNRHQRDEPDGVETLLSGP